MSHNVVRQQQEMELRVFRFKNEPQTKEQPVREERVAERTVYMSNIFNDVMVRAMARATR